MKQAQGKLHNSIYQSIIGLSGCLPSLVASEAEMGGAAEEGLGKMFRDPNMWGKLAANPKTAPLLADPQFAAQVSHFIFYILLGIISSY